MRPVDIEGPIPTSQGLVRVVGREALADHPAWRRCLVDQRKDWRFYEVLEETLDHDHDYRYAVVEAADGQVLCVQPRYVLDQDMLEGSGAVVRRAAAALRRVVPRLLMARTVMVGCAAGEGHLDVAASEAAGRVVAALREGVAEYARRIGARLVVFKEFSASYRRRLEALTAGGYARVPSMPMTRLNIDYGSFDELLARAMSKSARKDLRRKLRGADKAPPLELSVTSDVTEIADEVYPLYLQVYDRSRLRFEKLTRDYFCQLGSRMPDRTRFFVWRQLGQVVAFGLCLVHGDAIYDEYIGLDYRVALDLHLYFVTLAGVLAWAIANGYKWYYSTSQGYGPKRHLGCELVPLDLYVRHTSRPVNFVLRRILPWLEPTRGEPVLREFPNYKALWGDA
jgi:predicted N-acyltransferase